MELPRDPLEMVVNWLDRPVCDERHPLHRPLRHRLAIDDLVLAPSEGLEGSVVLRAHVHHTWRCQRLAEANRLETPVFDWYNR